MYDPTQDVEKILLTEQQIDDITTRMADIIRRDYTPADGSERTRKLIVVAVIKGSVFFYVDLVRKLNMPVELDFIKASSYYADPSRSCLHSKRTP